MKNLLSIFGAIAVIGTTASTVVSCQKNKIPLNTVISVVDLGTIPIVGKFPTMAELIPAIQAKNPGASALNGDNIRFFGQPTSTSARMQGLREYQGFVTLTYNAGPKPVENDLTKIITTTNLGAIVMANASGPTADELLRGIVAVNSSANSLKTTDFTMTNVTGTSATITGKNGYVGTVNLTYTREVNLANIIKTTNLGKIIIAAYPGAPTAAELLTGIKAVNSPTTDNLTVNDFNVSAGATSTNATITGNGVYTGTVNLTYTVQGDLTKIVTTLNLGSIAMAGATPTLAEILVGVKAANPNAAGLTTSNVSLTGTATATQATITGSGNPYTGNVTVTYQKAFFGMEKNEENNLIKVEIKKDDDFIQNFEFIFDLK